VRLVDDTLDRIDRFQRPRPWAAFPLAVTKKFGDDQAGYLAALIAYYTFFSMFPLLLVLVTVLGMVLHGNPHLADSIEKSVLGQFPVIGDQIKLHSLSGSGVALFVGILLTLYGGLGGVKAAQNAMDTVWGVPRKRRPNFLTSLKRAVLMLAVIGVAAVAATMLSGIATGGGRFGPVVKIAGLLGAVALNLCVFLLAFRLLTVAKLSWGDVLPGAIVAAALWETLQLGGAYIVGHQIAHANQTYGVFALVIVLLSWLYLGAQVTLYAAEINVVRLRRLWPRALRNPPDTEADEITLRREARQEERVPKEEGDVRFEEQGDHRV
jgi:membrane protein